MSLLIAPRKRLPLEDGGPIHTEGRTWWTFSREVSQQSAPAQERPPLLVRVKRSACLERGSSNQWLDVLCSTSFPLITSKETKRENDENKHSKQIPSSIQAALLYFIIVISCTSIPGNRNRLETKSTIQGCIHCCPVGHSPKTSEYNRQDVCCLLFESQTQALLLAPRRLEEEPLPEILLEEPRRRDLEKRLRA